MIVRCCLIGSVLLLLYTFAGYPLLLWLRARFWSRPVAKADFQPSVTVLIAAHNEERVIKRKLDSILSSNFSAAQINVIVISDGSTDATEDIVLAYPDRRVRFIRIEERVGKAAALNFGVREAKGEIVVFTDARQVLERDSLRALVSNFADSQVGCVSGLLMIGHLTSAPDLSGEQLKWQFENTIREWEGSAGSVVGALGAFYAARRSLIVEIPPGTLLDDCYVPLHIVRRGYRTVFEKNARVWDDVITTPAQEFGRKVRTLTGNYQLLQISPWLVTYHNPIWWEFLSHKFCRLLVPFLLAVLLAASLHGPGLALRLFGLVQLATYLGGIAALAWPALAERFRSAEVARAVLVMNAATLMAFVNFATGKYSVWTRRPAS
jgi:biofilm PGA synthesis N-glycosyltransferase PgaC